MSDRTEVRITVLDTLASGQGASRRCSCTLVVVSTRPLPRAPYAGTVRVAGVERTTTGTHACRMLKPYEVARDRETPEGVRYVATIEIGDEGAGSGAAYAAPGVGVRRVDESPEQICKRVAGLFGRHCEGFRPPSVIVKLGE